MYIFSRDRLQTCVVSTIWLFFLKCTSLSFYLGYLSCRNNIMAYNSLSALNLISVRDSEERSKKRDAAKGRQDTVTL